MIRISITKTGIGVATDITYLRPLEKPKLELEEGLTHRELEYGIFNVIEQLKKEAYDKGRNEVALDDNETKPVEINVEAKSIVDKIFFGFFLAAYSIASWGIIELIRLYF